MIVVRIDLRTNDMVNALCSYAIRPRLAIPAALAAGVYGWNHSGLEPQLGWGDDIALIVGFLSFKVSCLSCTCRPFL